jgi:MinD-like ATPase involved in chromosome partitioning or flagellar assembly
MSLAATSIGGAPASVDRWFDHLSPITRFFDVVVTDWGRRDARIDLADVAAASHVLCIVARADRHSAEQAAAVVDAVRSRERAPIPVIALVDAGGTAGAASGIVARSTDAPVVSIPYDPARASDDQLSSSGLATRTRLAYGRLAEELMTHAVGGGDPRERRAGRSIPLSTGRSPR